MNDELAAEIAARLQSLGVRGKALERVLAEVRDHLEESARAGDEAPAARFGDPSRFAQLVAAQLATTRTRRAVLSTFGVLSLVGIVYVAIFALVPVAGGWSDIFGGHVPAFGPVLGLATVLLPQIALVSGCLALLQAFRIRRYDVAGRPELALLRRRSTVALAAAAAALVSLAAFALDFEGTMAAWWTWLAVATSAALLVPLVTSGYLVSDTACPAPAQGGPAGDVFDDFELLFRWAPVSRLHLPEHPWRFAILCAGGVATAGFLVGWYAEGDPVSGLVRGGLEAVAILVCFALLGRPLGLRRS